MVIMSSRGPACPQLYFTVPAGYAKIKLEADLTSQIITEQLRRLPTSPGVYLMRDAGGNILYVGKAASLRSRVRSYFSAPLKLSPKLQRLVAAVHDLDFFITGSEQEALILELNLIKRHHPRYN
ncbi:MAG: GIY-YIG nuclease family protein, partial [Chloroflexota bacterium]